MRLLGTSRHRRLASLVSVTILLAAGAACGTSGSESRGVPPSTKGRGAIAPILAPPPTAPTTTTTTVIVYARPVHIPRDPYFPEAIKEFGSIEIPALGLDHAAYEGVTLNNIDLGPSHWTGTAVPGQPGNTVFAGHRITNSHPFRHLDQLVPGDEVIFTVAGVRSVYRVTGSMIVSPEETWIADPSPDATGTLYACHPPGSLAYRIVVKLALAS